MERGGGGKGIEDFRGVIEERLGVEQKRRM